MKTCDVNSISKMNSANSYKFDGNHIITLVKTLNYETVILTVFRILNQPHWRTIELLRNDSPDLQTQAWNAFFHDFFSKMAARVRNSGNRFFILHNVSLLWPLIKCKELIIRISSSNSRSDLDVSVHCSRRRGSKRRCSLRWERQRDRESSCGVMRGKWRSCRRADGRRVGEKSEMRGMEVLGEEDTWKANRASVWNGAHWVSQWVNGRRCFQASEEGGIMMSTRKDNSE